MSNKPVGAQTNRTYILVRREQRVRRVPHAWYALQRKTNLTKSLSREKDATKKLEAERCIAIIKLPMLVTASKL